MMLLLVGCDQVRSATPRLVQSYQGVWYPVEMSKIEIVQSERLIKFKIHKKYILNAGAGDITVLFSLNVSSFIALL